MLTNRDTSELDISNRMIRLWELEDAGEGDVLTKHGCKVSSEISNLQRKRSKEKE